VGLLVVAGLHVAAALMHLFYYRDGVMRRMLLGGPAIKAFVAE
jgi:cytochrome b561